MRSSSLYKSPHRANIPICSMETAGRLQSVGAITDAYVDFPAVAESQLAIAFAEEDPVQFRSQQRVNEVM